MHRKKQRILEWSVTAALAGGVAGAHASGFQLMEQNASGLGNAYAGQAAAAENASTVFFNPAGMTRLPGRQVSAALNFIRPSAEFTNSGGSAAPAGFSSPGGNGGDAGAWNMIPNTYASWQVSPQVWVGLGITVPFGLSTEYDEGWFGRFQSRKSSVKTIDVNPSVALKVSDMLSIGAGVSFQHAEVKVDRSVFTGGESRANINIDDNAWGFNLGAMINLNPQTRVGVTYRSAMKHELEGDVRFINAPGGGTPTNNVAAGVTLPDTISVGVSHTVNNRLELLGDLTFTRWSKIKRIPLVTTTGSALTAANTILDTFTFEFKDSWRAGVGANYRWNDNFTLKVGAAYDKSPVEDFYRTVTLPDNDRTWLAIGGKHRLTRQAVVDWGYAHLFIKDAPINQQRGTAAPPLQGNVIGNYDANVNILSVQMTYGF